MTCELAEYLWSSSSRRSVVSSRSNVLFMLSRSRSAKWHRIRLSPVRNEGSSAMMCSSEVTASLNWPSFTNAIATFCIIFVLQPAETVDKHSDGCIRVFHTQKRNVLPFLNINKPHCTHRTDAAFCYSRCIACVCVQQSGEPYNSSTKYQSRCRLIHRVTGRRTICGHDTCVIL